KLQQAHVAQRQSTRYFASLSVRAGAATVNEWLQIPIDDQAPTPNTFRQKEEDFPESALLLNREDLPSSDTAFEDIVKTAVTSGTTGRDNALSAGRSRMAVFIKNGLELECELAHLRYARTQHQAKADVLDSHLYAGVTWKSFRNKLVRWRGNQRKIMASIGDLIPEDDLQAFDDDECESSSVEEILALPSDFSAQERAEYDLQVLEEYEL
ncbi:hypothetical protein K466DRAFT_444733, partial [Polyporus arcularius HHB13444]